jgi:subtilisin family serine protease
MLQIFRCLRRLWRAGATLLAACLALGLASPATAQTDPVVGREVVLMLGNGVAIETIASQYRLTVISQFGQRPIWRTRVNAGVNIGTTLTALKADARVRFAERNVEHQTPERRRNVVWAIGGSADVYASQWALHAIRLPEAHAMATGQGVRVAVLDTGIDRTHPVFKGRLARMADGRLLGRDFVGGDANPAEEGGPDDPGWGHGTHVSGLIALAAPRAQIMPVRVLDASGRGNVWVLAEAILWAVDPDRNPFTDDGAHVVNLSLGTSRKTRLLDIAVELATCSDDDDDEDEVDYSHPGFQADKDRCDARGGVVVMSGAGNSGTTTKEYPAAEAAEGQLSVAATTETRRLADFSTRGSWVQIAAPGELVTSAMPGGGWAVWSGTSMAAPLASGVAALVRQRNPDWKAVDVTKRIQDRSARLCGTAIRQLDARGAVEDWDPPDIPCF